MEYTHIEYSLFKIGMAGIILTLGISFMVMTTLSASSFVDKAEIPPYPLVAVPA